MYVPLFVCAEKMTRNDWKFHNWCKYKMFAANISSSTTTDGTSTVMINTNMRYDCDKHTQIQSHRYAFVHKHTQTPTFGMIASKMLQWLP